MKYCATQKKTPHFDKVPISSDKIEFNLKSIV